MNLIACTSRHICPGLKYDLKTPSKNIKL